MTAPGNRLVGIYLRELRHAAKDLPRSSRRELMEEITEHLEEALPPDATEAETRTELDRLGDPLQIAAEARERLGIAGQRGGTFEWITVCLLLAGGFLFVVGWLVGVVMLWSSRAWTTSDKLIGTLLLPFGFVGATIIAIAGRLAVGDASVGAGAAVWTVVRLALLFVPIFTAVYLGRRLRRAELA